MNLGRCDNNPTSDPNLTLVPYIDPNNPTNPSPNLTPNTDPSTPNPIATPSPEPTPNPVPAPIPEPTQNFRRTKGPFGAFLESMETYFHERNNGKTPIQAYGTKVDTYLRARGYRN